MILFINPFDRHRCLSKCLINISPSKAERSSPSRSTKLKVTLQDVYFEANIPHYKTICCFLFNNVVLQYWIKLQTVVLTLLNIFKLNESSALFLICGSSSQKKTLIVDSRSARDLRLVCLFYL